MANRSLAQVLNTQQEKGSLFNSSARKRMKLNPYIIQKNKFKSTQSGSKAYI
jgi:hypothetical protein